jgi:hypothetical protein
MQASDIQKEKTLTEGENIASPLQEATDSGKFSLIDIQVAI